MSTGGFKAGGNSEMDYHRIFGGRSIFCVVKFKSEPDSLLLYCFTAVELGFPGTLF